MVDLLRAGPISTYMIQGEPYLLISPFQAAVLQRLGVELKFYESNTTLHPMISTRASESTRVKERDVSPTEINKEQLDSFVKGLEKKLN